MSEWAGRWVGSVVGWRGIGLGEGTDVGRERRIFVINRVLIVLAVAAILGGLALDQWDVVLRNAILL